jgi:hypothetical protein
MSRNTGAFKAPSRHPRGYGGDPGARKRPPGSRTSWGGVTSPEELRATTRKRTGTSRNEALRQSRKARPSGGRKIRATDRAGLRRDAGK